AACRVMPGRGDAKESATENRPPFGSFEGRTVRVKRCGKSAPPRRQRRGHGKPHAEQGQIGKRRAPVLSRHERAVSGSAAGARGRRRAERNDRDPLAGRQNSAYRPARSLFAFRVRCSKLGAINFRVTAVLRTGERWPSASVAYDRGYAFGGRLAYCRGSASGGRHEP